MVGVLTFVIEVAVVRHYGLAVIFITPLAILLGEAQAHSESSASAIAWRGLRTLWLDALLPW
jgi:hypothetical protein